MKEPLLLVDDEVGMLRVLKNIFEQEYEPILARTVDEAERAMDQRPDCRIGMFDLRIPNASGQPPEQVGAGLIRRFTRRSDRAALGFSAERQLEGLARAAGAAGFVVKGPEVGAKEIAAAVAELPRPAPAAGDSLGGQDDYLWFLTEAAERHALAGQVVVLRDRKVVGSGDSHRTAWESFASTAAQRDEPLTRDDVVFVVVPPDAALTTSDLDD